MSELALVVNPTYEGAVVWIWLPFSTKCCTSLSTTPVGKVLPICNQLSTPVLDNLTTSLFDAPIWILEANLNAYTYTPDKLGFVFCP